MVKCNQLCEWNRYELGCAKPLHVACPLETALGNTGVTNKNPVTNGDHVRAMSDEELAAWIAGMTTVCECCAELNECEAPRGFNRCSHGVEDWLKQPYEGE